MVFIFVPIQKTYKSKLYTKHTRWNCRLYGDQWWEKKLQILQWKIWWMGLEPKRFTEENLNGYRTEIDWRMKDAIVFDNVRSVQLKLASK